MRRPFLSPAAVLRQDYSRGSSPHSPDGRTFKSRPRNQISSLTNVPCDKYETNVQADRASMQRLSISCSRDETKRRPLLASRRGDPPKRLEEGRADVSLTVGQVESSPICPMRCSMKRSPSATARVGRCARPQSPSRSRWPRGRWLRRGESVTRERSPRRSDSSDRGAHRTGYNAAVCSRVRRGRTRAVVIDSGQRDRWIVALVTRVVRIELDALVQQVRRKSLSARPDRNMVWLDVPRIGAVLLGPVDGGLVDVETVATRVGEHPVERDPVQTSVLVAASDIGVHATKPHFDKPKVVGVVPPTQSRQLKGAEAKCLGHFIAAERVCHFADAFQVQAAGDLV